MAKYSFKLKMKIVQEYLSGSISCKTLAKQYDIASSKSIKILVAVYQKFGEDGLQRSRQNAKRPTKIKLYA